MRRCSDRRALAAVLSALPSYLPLYEEVSARAGEDFSVAVFFAEVAREADALLCGSRDHEDEQRLECIAETLEVVVTELRVDAPPLLDAFFSALSPAGRARIVAYLGPASAHLTERTATQDAEISGPLSPAAPPRLRPRPRRYSGRAPRRRRRL